MHETSPDKPDPARARPEAWDAALYDGQHRYVADLARELLDELPLAGGPTVLDLGCGTGRMSRWLLDRGARVIGVDADPAMVAAARELCPEADVRQADARALGELSCDHALSNATLHWILEPGRVVSELARVLPPGGRFVAELGGARNLAGLLRALRLGLATLGVDFEAGERWYFPSVGQYTSLLEANGFSVEKALWFSRPTRLEQGEAGLASWYRMFAAGPLEQAEQRAGAAGLARVLELAAEHARPTLFRDGAWWADYVRLRVVAVRGAGT